VISKEIDSKQDLQQEESVQLPAEHRSFPDHGPPHLPGFGPPLPAGAGHPGLHNNGHTGPNSGSSDASTNDPWPLGRPDVSQIKVCVLRIYDLLLIFNQI
jgi:hypothetical protein